MEPELCTPDQTTEYNQTWSYNIPTYNPFTVLGNWQLKDNDSCSCDLADDNLDHSSFINYSLKNDNISDLHQLDGNVTLPSEPDLESSSLSDSSFTSIPQTNDQYSSLPTIYSANARSIFPKLNDLIQMLQNHRIDIAQIS